MKTGEPIPKNIDNYIFSYIIGEVEEAIYSITDDYSHPTSKILHTQENIIFDTFPAEGVIGEINTRLEFF